MTTIPISTISINSDGELFDDRDTHHMVDDDVEIVSARIASVATLQQMIITEKSFTILTPQS